eukprot:8407855-Pyramimonas_sp.AAC.1
MNRTTPELEVIIPSPASHIFAVISRAVWHNRDAATNSDPIAVASCSKSRPVSCRVHHPEARAARSTLRPCSQ